MIVYTSKQEKINLAQKPFSSGGEGSVYAVNSAPSRFKDVCVKIYSPGKTDQLREAKIKFMVSNPPQTIRGKGFLIGWPLDYVTDSHGKFLGFIMPLAFPNSRQLVELTVYSLSKVLGKEWHDRYDISAGKKSLISRLKLIFNIATPIHILHSTNKYVLKDFKPQNVLVTYDGHVTIVDLDSIQISDGGQMLYPGTAVTPEYMPPEFFTKGIGKSLKSPINKSWDYFAIGVVFYEILMGIHPYCVTPKKLNDISENSRSSNISLGLFPFGANKQMIEVRPRPHDRFTKLPQEFQNKFISTFSEKPGNRPSAYEWKQYVYDVIKGIDGDEEKIQDKKEFDDTGTVIQDKIEYGTTNDAMPEETRNKIVSLNRWAKYSYFLAALAFVFLPNVFRWNHWVHMDMEEWDSAPTLWLFWLPIVAIIWAFLGRWTITDQFSSISKARKERYNWHIFTVIPCFILLVWMFIESLNINNLFFSNYFYFDIYMGPIICGIAWCIGLYCEYKMSRIVKNIGLNSIK